MAENILLTSPENDQSPVYFTTDDSEVGSFIGDHMTSVSSGFEGFDISSRSLQKLAIDTTTKGSVDIINTPENANGMNKGINTLSNTSGSGMIKLNANPMQFNGPIGSSKEVTAILDSPIMLNTSGSGQNEVTQERVIDVNKNKLSENFSVNFHMIKDTSLCETLLDFPPQYAQVYDNDKVAISHLNININDATKSEHCPNVSVALKKDQTNTLTQTTLTPHTQRAITQTDIYNEQTDTNTDKELTNASDLKGMFTLMFEKMDKQGEKMDRQEEKMDRQEGKMNCKLDNLQIGINKIEGEVEQCKDKMIGLGGKVGEIAHQVRQLAVQVLDNSTEILKLKQENAQMEGIIAEKLLNSSLHLESKIEIIKGELNYNKAIVSDISRIIENSNSELEDLKRKCMFLEGAVTNNRDHGAQLNERLVGIANHMLSGTTDDPVAVKSLLQLISTQSKSTFIPKQALSAISEYPLNSMPSISSSPLTTPNFNVPDAIIKQATPDYSHKSYQCGAISEEEFILKGIFKREEIPSFDGSNISAPQFIEESETYFTLVNIMNDKNKVKVVGSFMKGVALQWWKRIVKDLNSWEEAKKEILEQYFSDYNRKKFKQQWKQHEYNKNEDVEQFVLQAFHLLDIVKPKYPFKKKCQAVASRLPSPLMTFLLQKDFSSEKDFMNVLKEAMILTNFENKMNTRIYMSSQNYTSGVSNNGYNNNHTNNSNQGCNNGGQAGDSKDVITNPNYKGRPQNFDPNYRQKMASRYNNGNSYRYGNNSSYANDQSRYNRNNGDSGNFRGRSWYNSNQGGPDRRPFYRDRSNKNNNGQTGNRQANSATGNRSANNLMRVSNAALTTPSNPTSTPTVQAGTIIPQSPGNVPVNTADTVFLSTALFNQLFKQNYQNMSTTGDGLNPTIQKPSN